MAIASELVSEFRKYLTVRGENLTDYIGFDLTADASNFLAFCRPNVACLPSILAEAMQAEVLEAEVARLAKVQALTQPRPVAQVIVGQDFMMGTSRFTYLGFIKSDMALGGTLHLARCLATGSPELSMFEGDELVTPRLD